MTLDALNPNPYMPMPFGEYTGIPIMDIVKKGKDERKYIQGIRDKTTDEHLSQSIHKAFIIFTKEVHEVRRHGSNVKKESTKAQA